MRDQIALPLLALVAVALIALALVWPQGQGTRSPPPFGRAVAAPPAKAPPPMASSPKAAPQLQAPPARPAFELRGEQPRGLDLAAPGARR
ncbi:MAG TPA: hypothetical protein VF459_01930 [Caulobacteraceae bacterium]